MNTIKGEYTSNAVNTSTINNYEKEIKTVNDVFSAEDFANSVKERIKGYNTDSVETQSEFQYNKPKPGLDFNPQLEMMRISAADTLPALKRVIASLESRVSFLKNSEEGQKIIPRIKRIIKKGIEKQGKLSIEERIQKAINNARKRREYTKASHKQAILSHRKMQRKKQEAEDIKNANLIADGCEETIPSLTAISNDFMESFAAENNADITNSAISADIPPECSADVGTSIDVSV